MAQLWFKFWAKEYLADAKIRSLTYEQRGILQTLWGFAWEEGSIPSDMKQVGMMLGIHANAMRTHSEWIARFFVVDPSDESKLLSPRLELDRMEADSRGAKARESALYRWSERNANAMRQGMPKLCERNANAMRQGMPKLCEHDAGQGQGQGTASLPPTPLSSATGKKVREKKGSAAAMILNDPEANRRFQEAWQIHPRRKDSAGNLRGAGSQVKAAQLIVEKMKQVNLTWDEVVQIHKEYLNHPNVQSGWAQNFETFWGDEKGLWMSYLNLIREKSVIYGG